MSLLLRKGSRGEQVKQLQKLLNSTLSANQKKISVDGDFGSGTLATVKLFQRENGLTADGVVGPKTWNALLSAAQPTTANKVVAFNAQAPLADIAKQYVGVKETGNNLAGKSKELLAIFKADTLAPNGRTDGYPWCAAFVSFCVQALQKKSDFYVGLNPPREASVSRFLNQWAKSNGCVVFNNKSASYQPQKGDIVVFVFSHIGIVEKTNGNIIHTIEGNTNSAGSREGNVVARKNRTKSLIKAYIRLPISTAKMSQAIEQLARTC